MWNIKPLFFIFTFYIFSRTRLLKWPVHGFWHTMAQSTHCDVRKCLLGSTRWLTTFWGSNSLKTVKIPFYRHVRTATNGFETNDVIEDWRHWLRFVARSPSLAERRILFIAFWESPLFVFSNDYNATIVSAVRWHLGNVMLRNITCLIFAVFDV